MYLYNATYPGPFFETNSLRTIQLLQVGTLTQSLVQQ